LPAKRQLLELGQLELHRNAHAFVDLPLLKNRQRVVGDPVQHQAGREEEKHHGKSQWHEPHQLSLQWIRWNRVQSGLDKRGQRHHDGQNEVGVLG